MELKLTIGDITKIPVDAMVNAANSALAGGGGVDGAIHRAGGPSIMLELDGIRRKIGRCETGSAVATGAGALPARWVLHAVGPRYRGGEHGEAELLASCYSTCLQMAEDREVSTISFPSISTGAYGYPTEAAAKIAVGVIKAHKDKPATKIREVTFVLFDRRTFDIYSNCAAAI